MSYIDQINASNGLGGVQGLNSMDPTSRLLLGAADYPPDSFQSSRRPKKRGFSLINAGLNFLQGGVVNTLKGMFSLKGIATMALAGGAVALTGGAAIPFLAALGIGMGGMQTFKGVSDALGKYLKGDSEGAEKAFQEIGSGVVGTAMSVMGARAAYKNGTIKTGTLSETGELTTSAKVVGEGQGLFGSTKATVTQMYNDISSTFTGKFKVLNAEGTGLTGRTLFQNAGDNALTNFGKLQIAVENKFTKDPSKLLEKYSKNAEAARKDLAAAPKDQQEVLQIRNQRAQDLLKQQRETMQKADNLKFQNEAYQKHQESMQQAREAEAKLASAQEKAQAAETKFAAKEIKKPEVTAARKALKEAQTAKKTADTAAKTNESAYVSRLSVPKQLQRTYVQRKVDAATIQEKINAIKADPTKATEVTALEGQLKIANEGINAYAAEMTKKLTTPEQYGQLERNIALEILDKQKAGVLEAAQKAGTEANADVLKGISANRDPLTFRGQTRNMFNTEMQAGRMPAYMVAANHVGSEEAAEESYDSDGGPF